MAPPKANPPHSIAKQGVNGGQSSFDEGDPGLVRALLSASKAVRALMELEVTHLGLRVGQDALLMALDARTPSPVMDIAGALAIRPSTVSKMVDKLESAGLVVRSNDSADGRRTLIQLTPAGVAMQARIREVWLTFDGELRREAGPSLNLAHLQQIEGLLRKRLDRLR